MRVDAWLERSAKDLPREDLLQIFDAALGALWTRTISTLGEGIVPGGGVALIRALASLDSLKFSNDRLYGVSIIRRAVEEPPRQIAANAGVEGSIVVDKVKNGKGSFGFNAATEEYEDLVKAGVIDPTKVVRAALQNAASVASLMLIHRGPHRRAPEEEVWWRQWPQRRRCWHEWWRRRLLESARRGPARRAAARLSVSMAAPVGFDLVQLHWSEVRDAPASFK